MFLLWRPKLRCQSNHTMLLPAVGVGNWLHAILFYFCVAINIAFCFFFLLFVYVISRLHVLEEWTSYLSGDHNVGRKEAYFYIVLGKQSREGSGADLKTQVHWGHNCQTEKTAQVSSPHRGSSLDSMIQLRGEGKDVCALCGFRVFIWALWEAGLCFPKEEELLNRRKLRQIICRILVFYSPFY